MVGPPGACVPSDSRGYGIVFEFIGPGLKGGMGPSLTVIEFGWLVLSLISLDWELKDGWVYL